MVEIRCRSAGPTMTVDTGSKDRADKTGILGPHMSQVRAGLSRNFSVGRSCCSAHSCLRQTSCLPGCRSLPKGVLAPRGVPLKARKIHGFFRMHWHFCFVILNISRCFVRAWSKIGCRRDWDQSGQRCSSGYWVLWGLGSLLSEDVKLPQET
jgi:hypothetical protein